MDEQLKKNLSAASIWLRALYMILFAFVIYVAIGVLVFVVVLQFLVTLINGEANLKIARFADVLCQYLGQCFKFECFLTEEKPFPFDDFPQSSISEPALADSSEVATEESEPDKANLEKKSDAAE